MDAHSRRPVVRVIGTVLAMLAAVAAVAGSAAATMTDSPAGVADKVDPAVLAAFDSHAEATFWVVLRDRANLRPAARSKGHLHGHRERADAVTGTAGSDILIGQNGNDILSGPGANDLLCGGRGDDRLTGGVGADRFSGGQGSDTATDLTPAQGDTQDGTVP